MATPTGTDPHRAPVPPGWPGDDPTLPEDDEQLDGRPRRGSRPPARAERSGRGGPRGPGRVARTVVSPDVRERAHGDVDVPPEDAVSDERLPPRRVAAARSRVSGAVRASVDLPTDLARPPDPPRGDDEDGYEVEDEHVLDDDLIAGLQPAGRVLVIMVAALVLAMLVNADAMVERAERRPAGTARDRSLAIWHPVQDVSHVLQLHRVRQLADRVAGDDDAPVAPAESARDSRRAPGSPRSGGEPAGDGAVGDEAAGDSRAPFPLRTPTEDDPLRLWVGGDFTAQTFGESLVAASEATDVIDAELHYESASGLSRHDYYDWPRALEDDVAEHEPEVAVIVVGANDAQGIVLPDGEPVQLDDPRWVAEYQRRVGALMDQLRADDRMVVWVGQPPMRAPDFAARMAMLNQAYAAEAAGRPWVTFVDPGTILGDPHGSYADVVTDATGAPAEVRRPDGIHLTTAGADLLAAHVLALVEAQVDLEDASDDPVGD